MKTLQEKIDDSINLIKQYETLAMKHWDGYTVCFSGGKDSQVLLDLFKKSCVKFHAVYNCTTNDEPKNVYFIRKNYPDVEFILPKLNFYQLIEKNRRLPQMNTRFCCRHLKEYYGKGFTATGVRREESARRAQYPPVETTQHNTTIDNIKPNSKIHFRPILDWTEQDIWNYIELNNIPINPCYDDSGRVGCMFCPFQSTIRLHYMSKKYPKHFKLLLNAIEKAMEQGYMREFKNISPKDVFNWWASKQTTTQFFKQLKLEL